jgi:hypothetical protein
MAGQAVLGLREFFVSLGGAGDAGAEQGEGEGGAEFQFESPGNK